MAPAGKQDFLSSKIKHWAKKLFKNNKNIKLHIFLDNKLSFRVYLLNSKKL